MEQQEIIDVWINSSDDNYKSMINMLKACEYMWSLFIGHLMMNTKEAYGQNVRRNLPKKTLPKLKD